MIQTGAVAPLIQLDMVWGKHTEAILPTENQNILDRHKDRFSEPHGLPPARACDHRIPLLPGALPVSIRPYHYSPRQKDDLEKHVKTMLSQ